MSALDSLLDTPLAYHLGWALVHFLWQGLLVGIAYAALRLLLKDASPKSRYWLSLGTLAALAALPVFTFVHLSAAPAAPPVLTGHAEGVSILVPATPSALDMLRRVLHPLIPWTVPAWCVGVVLLALKSFFAWQRALILTRRAAETAPDAWQQTLARLALSVGVRMHVRLLVTARVTVPCVVGWLKPVILLPPSALTGLTPLQLEMVLAHELSHIRRLDYLVNLLQVAVETLLFYHPVVRWISRDVRRERELCCDDSAVQACGDALHYAHALADLERLRGIDPSPAMGINGGDLVMRVERLITPHHAAAAPRLTGVMLLSALCLGGMLALASSRHMPLSALQSFNLPLPPLHAVSGAEHPASASRAVPLAPTETELEDHRTARPAALQAAEFGAPLLREVSAPPQPLPQAVPSSQTAPKRVGGQPLSALIYPESAERPTELEMNKRANAEMHVVNVKASAPTAAGNHDYCEPITGSRICN